MKNTQKFHRSDLVLMFGQTESPVMTITNIFRNEVIINETEKVMEYSYECSWFAGKRRKAEKLILDEICLKKFNKRLIRLKKDSVE